jgi:hypothetical protein
VACAGYVHAVARARISTTVDCTLLTRARDASSGVSDAELVDQALVALLAQDRAAEIDGAYAKAYTEHPLSEPDEWGDVEAFLRAPGA